MGHLQQIVIRRRARAAARLRHLARITSSLGRGDRPRRLPREPHRRARARVAALLQDENSDDLGRLILPATRTPGAASSTGFVSMCPSSAAAPLPIERRARSASTLLEGMARSRRSADDCAVLCRFCATRNPTGDTPRSGEHVTLTTGRLSTRARGCLRPLGAGVARHQHDVNHESQTKGHNHA
jgi:hypothetical protein